MQLFGFKEDIGRSLAPSQALPLGSAGSRLTTGGCFQQPPVRVVCQTFQTQGVMSTSTEAHDPSVGEDADTSPASLGRKGYLEGRRNAAER